MSEFEQRLRAAMDAAFADEQPPGDLAETIRRRHRRHRIRAAAGAAAAVVIIAMGALAVRAGAHDSSRPGASGPGGPAAGTAPAMTPPARSRNVVDSCPAAIWSRLPAGWQRQSLRAGPLWLVGLRQPGTAAVKEGNTRIGGLLVLVRNGVTAWVTVVGPADGYFRLLFGPNDFARGLDGPYNISDGETGVTFAGCPPAAQGGLTPGYTQYGGYFLVTVPRSCVTLDVWTQTGGNRERVTFPVGSAHC